ncbi:MAG: hypothetical protein IPM97_03320 [Bdellovibrionaceae bacterium]|nr:hypothetical protein [Pseudobdellovibrionaceae bacterium]
MKTTDVGQGPVSLMTGTPSATKLSAKENKSLTKLLEQQFPTLLKVLNTKVAMSLNK